MTVAHIEIPAAEIASLCRRNGIRKLAFFGSVLTERFSDHSDIDVLVEFRPDERVGFFRLADIQDELSRLLDGRTIDLRTPMDLSRHFRAQVVRDASVVYAEPWYHSPEAHARGPHDGVAYGGRALPVGSLRRPDAGDGPDSRTRDHRRGSLQDK